MTTSVVSLAKKVIAKTLKLAFVCLRFFAKAIVAIAAAAWRGCFVAADAAHSRHLVRGQLLRCPRGHLTPLHGVFECTKCGYVYDGTVLKCANPECHATTAHVACSVCGLSIRSPYRWGRPGHS